jgi:purine-binding chemotaxis protein CheW
MNDDPTRADPLRTRAILDERARTLARVPDRADAVAAGPRVAIFAIGGERFAIEARHVLHVFRASGLTPIPGVPAEYAGVINHRGEILAVLDLGRMLGVEPGEGTRDDAGWILVLADDRGELGALVDAVHEVRTLGTGELLDRPAVAEQAVRHDYVLGVTGDALILIDGGALLRDDRLDVDRGEDPGPAARSETS